MKSFIELAKERYSVRKFSETPVEQEKLDLIIEAGRIAPTARNFQPQRIFVAKSREALDALNSVCPCIYGAPVVLVVCFDKNTVSQSKVREGHTYGETDAAIVCTHMMLEAADLGLGSCWVGWFAEKDVKQVLNLPENLSVCDLLPIGYAVPDAAPAAMHTSKLDKSETVFEI